MVQSSRLDYSIICARPPDAPVRQAVSHRATEVQRGFEAGALPHLQITPQNSVPLCLCVRYSHHVLPQLARRLRRGVRRKRFGRASPCRCRHALSTRRHVLGVLGVLSVLARPPENGNPCGRPVNRGRLGTNGAGRRQVRHVAASLHKRSCQDTQDTQDPQECARGVRSATPCRRLFRG